MCRLIRLGDCNRLQSGVTADVFDPVGDDSSLWTGQSDSPPSLFFSSLFPLFQQPGIVLPILE